MLGGAELVTFVATTDLSRAEEFFGGVLGLEHVETTPFAAVFRSGTGALRVTLVERVRAAGYTVLGWLVTDIDAAVAQLADRGVALLRYEGMAQDARGVWSAPGGAKVAWFHDPDGNVLSLTQTSMDHSTHR